MNNKSVSILSLSFLFLYIFSHKFIPVSKYSHFIGAFFLIFFLMVFLVVFISFENKKKVGITFLLGVLLISLGGVYISNKSLYNFMTVPKINKNVKFLESNSFVSFIDTKDGKEKVVLEIKKKYWLIKSLLINIFLLCVATSAGIILGKKVEKKSHIFAILFLGGVMDIWSVFSGVTKNIITSKYNCYFFLFNWTVPGSDVVTYPLIGSTDFLFASLFLCLVYRFGLSVKYNIIGISLGLLISVIFAGFLGVGIPALPFIGLSILLVNFKEIIPDKSEFIQILIGSIIIFTTFSIIWRKK